jgi:hypothetical protein
MLTFEEFIEESLILEMPHLKIGDQFFDLELEVHAKMKPKDFIQYIDDWVNGKPIQSKTPGFSMQVNANSVKEFAKKVLAQPYLKNFTAMHYGEDTWAAVEKLLRSKL